MIFFFLGGMGVFSVHGEDAPASSQVSAPAQEATASSQNPPKKCSCQEFDLSYDLPYI